MFFIDNNGEELELKVLGYQFPSNLDGDWDSNWLRIYIHVKSRSGSWQTVDPSLTTWELKKALMWFKGILERDDEIETELTFTEPNLSFRLVDKTPECVKIQIHFNLESRPESADDDQEYFIELSLSNKDLEKLIRDLQIEYDKFPERYLPDQPKSVQ